MNRYANAQINSWLDYNLLESMRCMLDADPSEYWREAIAQSEKIIEDQSWIAIVLTHMIADLFSKANCIILPDCLIHLDLSGAF